MCMSAGGVLALPDWGWPYPDALFPELSTADVNRAITTDPAPQQSPSIAVDPLDPAHIVLAFMDYSLGFEASNGIFVARSDNRGLSWLLAVRVASHQHGQQRRLAAGPLTEAQTMRLASRMWIDKTTVTNN